MKDSECISFLRWALPELRMRWQGFRKVRKQVCRRIAKRMQQLGIPDERAYRSYLDHHSDEWTVLDSLCRITISRFCRDRGLFDVLAQDILPELARNAARRGETVLNCWSIGCASGEEPYSIALLWEQRIHSLLPNLEMGIVATDNDPNMIRRAQDGCYGRSSLREIPGTWLDPGFFSSQKQFCVRNTVKSKVTFLEQDIRRALPEGLFHLVLCRNVVFTYFEEELQREILERIKKNMHARGVLVLGSHETLPQGATGFDPCPGARGVFLSIDQNEDPGGKREKSENGPAPPEVEVEEGHEALENEPHTE